MHILLKLTSSNHYSDGGCEFALVGSEPRTCSAGPAKDRRSEIRRLSIQTSSRRITPHFHFPVRM
jgi:hypothetical protein